WVRCVRFFHLGGDSGSKRHHPSGVRTGNDRKVMLGPSIVESAPQPENLRVVEVTEIPSLTSSYAKVATGAIRPKKSVAVTLPGTRWETDGVISRKLVDEYNGLLGAS